MNPPRRNSQAKTKSPNPSGKRSEGFLHWEQNTPRQERDQSIRSVLDQLTDRLGIAARLRDQKVLETWSGIVGERIALATRAVAIHHGVLTVEVINPSWRQELTYLGAEIITKLNRSLGYNLVKKIKFC